MCQTRTPGLRAEDVEVRRLDPVEHARVQAHREAHARAHRGGGGGDRRPRAGEQGAGALHLVGDQGADRRAGRVGGEVVLGHAEALAVLRGEVDAVQAPVLAHVADEVGQLERQAEAAEVGVVTRGHAEQRGHDPPDRAGRAVHVGHELLPRGDPHRGAVDAHRAHVGAQLAEREPVAGGGVGQGAHDRLAGLGARVELRLPGVQHGAPAVGRGRAARAVDDLVGGAHVAVEGVRGGSQLGRKAARREVVRGVVAALHPPRRLVPLPQRRVHDLHSVLG